MWNQYSEKSPEVSQDVTVRLDINSRVKKLIHEYFILSFNLKKEPNVKEFMDYLTDNVPDIAENITTKTLIKLFDEERNSIESIDETTPRIQDQESMDIANDTKSSDMNLSDDFENLGFEKRVEKTKLIQFFEYLKAYRSKLEEPIRNISKYDDIVVWYNDIPIGEGCFLSKGGKK
ncbi:hypothetical protein [Thermoanaerobacterium sp. RBIITD]|uniref:hypothetical protein n=1 Tax=Thermoanaerobacterium sp. RBIITD TaxID=1550240 RepID=UPI000BB82EED|nr:hypothetical protein [Thermoanaerobacterium sp. RBIITD]SNX52896.1 hypothetical protein SAMN05660242_0356 [Thermoanaerobacterium sp. RBIITD]